MGDDFLRKRKHQFKTIGDRSKAKLAAPGLWSGRPDVLATDITFNPSGAGAVTAGETLTIESIGGKLRAICGYREVGVADGISSIHDAVVERGGVATATVQECSVFGGFSARIREEDD